MQNQTQVKQKPTVFKMGKFTFEYPVKHPKKKPIHKEAMKGIRNEESDTLDLSWGKYKRFKWFKVLKNIKESEVQRISAYGNSDKNIMITLSQISFFNLTHLDLGGECKIENIDCMPTGPNLNYLSLINNNIYSTKPLAKNIFPRLKTLLLNDNPIKQLGIQRCDFELETYWLERKYNYKTITESLGQACLFKMKNNELKGISVESTARIYQPVYIQKIRDKFPVLEKILYVQPQDLFNSDEEFVEYFTEDQDNNHSIQDVNFIQAQIIEPHALYFVQGDEQENWIQQTTHISIDSNLKKNEEKHSIHSNLKKNEEKHIIDSQAQEERENEQKKKKNQQQSNQFQGEDDESETDLSESSCWDSNLEEYPDQNDQNK